LKKLSQTKKMKPTPLVSLCHNVLLLIFVTASSSLASNNPYIYRHGINFSTGNKYFQQKDISLPGADTTIMFSRNYNSQSKESSILGFGWNFSWNDRLVFGNSFGLAILIRSDGSMVHFSPQGTDTWISKLGKKTIIIKTDTGYILTESNNTRLFFNNDGRLIEKRDRNSNSIILTYDGQNLKTISDTFGRNLTLNYSADSLLEKLSTPIGTFSYGYDTNKNLISATKPDGSVVHYLYEDPKDIHNLTGVIDANNVRTQTTGYDAADRVVSSSLANGSEAIAIAYESNYKRIITDSLGIATIYQLEVYQGVARVGSMTGPGCSSCGGNSNIKYAYNDRSQITEATDANGMKTAYTYDEAGNTTSVTKAFGTPLVSTTTSTYDPATNRIATVSKPSVANPSQQTVTRMTYDEHGNLLSQEQSGFSESDQISSITRYTYTNDGQIATIDGPRSDVDDATSFTYYPNDAGQGNNRGNLHTVTNALGHTTTYSDYNVFGQAETVTDANNRVNTRAYDANGLLTSATTAELTTKYAYNAAGQLLTVTLPGSKVITCSYTLAGQIEKITDSLGNSITYAYDSEGRRTGEEIRDPQNALTRYAGYGYDDNGRLNKVTLPDEAEETSEYDLVGNLVKTINATGMETEYQYDLLNRLQSVTEAGEATAGYTHDGHDNVKTVTDANNKVTTFTSDDFGRKIFNTAPDTGLTDYSYDAAGNLNSVTDAKEQTITYAYDALNRPVSQSYADGDDILFTYDQGANAIGRLSRITDWEGTDSFAYDTAGRLVTETRVIGPTTHTIVYIWNAATGELAGMTYPSGLTLSYSRDAGGQISAIDMDGATLVSAVTHLPFGPLKTATLGSVSLNRDYDQRYNVARIAAGSLDYGYTRDAGGNVTKIAGIQIPTTAGGTIEYNYNPANNQLTTAIPKEYSYDANGNMTSDGTRTFTYDALNRLIKVEQQGATVATYGYNSANRRISKTVGETTTHYIYDLNSQLIAETLVDGTPLREYIYLDGEPLALREYESNPGTYYFVNDHLGTPQQLVTATGTVIWQAAYLAYGQAQIQVQAVKNNLRFPGQYYDTETGLHYNWHRFYDPETGRYISADPIGLTGGMNLYAYVKNDPINWIDPWGLLGEVVTFQPVGWGSSSFGHTAYNDNGTVYSFGPNGMWKGSFEDYMKKNDFREAVGAVLNLTPQQEDMLRKCLEKDAGSYGKFTNNCGDPLERCLEELGFDLGANLFPVGLGEALEDGGNVREYIFYPRNPDLPAPKPGSSAPWAR
jgi:RHS repeat-associated protein